MTRSRNPHVGLPFDDDDATIAAAVEDVSRVAEADHSMAPPDPPSG